MRNISSLYRALSSLPEEYQPDCCRECRIRKIYARYLDAHFDYRDCPYVCEVRHWQPPDEPRETIIRK